MALGIPKARIALIPGSGVDITRFNPLPEPAGPPTMAFVGRLLDDKGIGTLVAAHRLLRARGSNVQLLIAGTPDPANPASVTPAEAASWNNEPGITWLGQVDDIAESLGTRSHRRPAVTPRGAAAVASRSGGVRTRDGRDRRSRLPRDRRSPAKPGCWFPSMKRTRWRMRSSDFCRNRNCGRNSRQPRGGSSSSGFRRILSADKSSRSTAVCSERHRPPCRAERGIVMPVTSHDLAVLGALGGAAIIALPRRSARLLILMLRPLLERYALARPNARSSHTTPTPQGGGIAVVAATIATACGALYLLPSTAAAAQALLDRVCCRGFHRGRGRCRRHPLRSRSCPGYCCRRWRSRR